MTSWEISNRMGEIPQRLDWSKETSSIIIRKNWNVINMNTVGCVCCCSFD